LESSASLWQLKKLCLHDNAFLQFQVVYNANKLEKLVAEKKKKQNWLDYYQIKYSRNPEKRPMTKVILMLHCYMVSKNVLKTGDIYQGYKEQKGVGSDELYS